MNTIQTNRAQFNAHIGFRHACFWEKVWCFQSLSKSPRVPPSPRTPPPSPPPPSPSSALVHKRNEPSFFSEHGTYTLFCKLFNSKESQFLINFSHTHSPFIALHQFHHPAHSLGSRVQRWHRFLLDNDHMLLCTRGHVSGKCTLWLNSLSDSCTWWPSRVPLEQQANQSA